MAGKQFALDPAGNPVEIQPHQAEGAANAGYKAISPEAASAHLGAAQAEERVDQRFGTVGKALAGVGGGLTLGLGPALANKLGVIDRPDLEALQETGAYQAGDIAGMIAPAFLSGGESLAVEGAVAGAERAGGSLIGRALGMTPAGLLGRAGGLSERLAGAVLPEVGASGLGKQALQMAARGATEGAIVGISHEVAQDVIQNKPFTAQAMAASGLDGALFGGLTGGVIGGVGALAGKGVDAIGGAALGRGVGSGERSAAIALKRLGAEGSDLAALSEGGPLNVPLKAMHDILAGEGESLASTTGNIRKAVMASETRFGSQIDHVASQLDDGARQLAPSLERVEARLQNDVNVKYANTLQYGEATKAAEKLKGEMAPMQPRVPSADAAIEYNAPKLSLPEKPTFEKLKLPQKEQVPKPELPKAMKEPVKPELKEATVVNKKGGASTWKTYTAEHAENLAKYHEEMAAFKANAKAIEQAKAAHAAKVAEAESRHANALREHAAKTEAQNTARAEHSRAVAEAKAAHVAEMDKYNLVKAVHDGGPAMLPGPKGTWKDWIKSRNQLADLASKTKDSVHGDVVRTALNAVDDEIRTSMLAAEESLGQKGLSAQYEAAKVGKKLAGEMKVMVGKRVGTELAGAESTVGARDIGTFVGMAAIGYPLSGLGFVAAKGVGKMMQRRVEPQIAEAAYRMSVGSEAAGATVAVGKHIQNSLRRFMGVAGRVAADENFKESKQKFTLANLEKTIEANDRLTSSVHIAKVKDMADSLSAMGHPELAQEFVLQNQRAVEYLQWNSRGVDRKAKGLGQLTKPPKATQMDDKAWKFLRIDKAIKAPLATLFGGLEDGSLSRDQVKAIKYVYPDLHAEVVTHAAQEIMALKNEGKYVGADKVAGLGLLLDAPVDSTLEKGYIDAVQQALAANREPQPAPQQQSSKPFVSESTPFQTPLQSSLAG